MELSILVIAAFLGSTLNAGAGGGSFITYPVLVSCGVPLLSANATSTIVLWPGSISSAIGYRNDYNMNKQILLLFIGCSLSGSIVGTYLLLNTNAVLLSKIIPFLMLFASSILIFKNKIKQFSTEKSLHKSYLFQFLVGIYGGYFGGGMGIMMIAVLTLSGFKDIIQINAIKSLLGAFINGTAAFIFVFKHEVQWHYAFFMIVASLMGGYWGASIIKKIKSQNLNQYIIVLGICTSIYFFYKGWWN